MPAASLHGGAAPLTMYESRVVDDCVSILMAAERFAFDLGEQPPAEGEVTELPELPPPPPEAASRREVRAASRPPSAATSAVLTTSRQHGLHALLAWLSTRARQARARRPPPRRVAKPWVPPHTQLASLSEAETPPASARSATPPASSDAAPVAPRSSASSRASSPAGGMARSASAPMHPGGGAVWPAMAAGRSPRRQPGAAPRPMRAAYDVRTLPPSSPPQPRSPTSEQVRATLSGTSPRAEGAGSPRQGAPRRWSGVSAADAAALSASHASEAPHRRLFPAELAASRTPRHRY